MWSQTYEVDMHVLSKSNIPIILHLYNTISYKLIIHKLNIKWIFYYILTKRLNYKLIKKSYYNI